MFPLYPNGGCIKVHLQSGSYYSELLTWQLLEYSNMLIQCITYFLHNAG